MWNNVFNYWSFSFIQQREPLIKKLICSAIKSRAIKRGCARNAVGLVGFICNIILLSTLAFKFCAGDVDTCTSWYLFDTWKLKKNFFESCYKFFATIYFMFSLKLASFSKCLKIKGFPIGVIWFWMSLSGSFELKFLTSAVSCHQ